MSRLSEVRQSNATSYADMKAQEVKKVGLPPLRQEMEMSPLEHAQTKDQDFFAVNNPAALQLDANVAAKQLIGLDGLPE
ncbi:MAG: hypothetical protein K2L24_03755 [Opitutales bacterium]|nr:hypothetical protein [Opitutales bacterium]